jgi:hypothetical protein
MEIRCEPYELLINDKNIINCIICNNLLIKEIKEGSYLINDCGYCRYSDRPFVIGSSSLYNHYPEGCTCEYGKKEFLYIICNICKFPKCNKCGIKINNCISKCNNCEKILEKNKFNEKWNISNPIEKLNMYGIIKLKKIAKMKNLKGYSKYNKNELIEKLKLLVNDNDFPIK